MIEIFSNALPFRLAIKIINEYNSRVSEINYILEKRYKYYSPLREQEESVKMLLAMSIFYKRIVSNIDSSIKFSGRLGYPKIQLIK